MAINDGAMPTLALLRNLVHGRFPAMCRRHDLVVDGRAILIMQRAPAKLLVGTRSIPSCSIDWRLAGAEREGRLR